MATQTKSSQIRELLLHNTEHLSKWGISKKLKVQPSQVYSIAKRLDNPVQSKHEVRVGQVRFNSKSDMVRDYMSKNPNLNKYQVAKNLNVDYSFVFGICKRDLNNQPQHPTKKK